MKLSYIFYLLCFLICIEWSFCYEIISNDALNLPSRQIYKKSKTRHRSNRVRNRSRRQQPRDHWVDNLDVASFIQQPDGDFGSEHLASFYDRSQKRNQRPREYCEYENANFKEDIAPEKAIAEKKHGYFDFLGRISTKKPSQLQNQNFPFFSHDQPDKKKKKRKLFGIRSKTTSADMRKPDVKQMRSQRSNIFCSNCKKKPTTNSKKKGNIKQKTSKTIHNSRQYFQLVNDNVAKSKQKTLTEDVSYRIRRNREHLKPTEEALTLKKYMHEIDELEQQIDNNLPNLGHQKKFTFLNESTTRTVRNERVSYKKNKKRNKRLQENLISFDRILDENKIRQFKELKNIENKINKVKIKGFPNMNSDYNDTMESTTRNEFDNH